jgi:hypothetical protein
MAVPIDRSLRLPQTEFFPGAEEKSGIAIHHTVGGSARATFRWWLADKTDGGRPQIVGTAYIIDLDGTVFEVFDPTAWAYQFGLGWTPAARLQFEKRFIGIEIASEGALIEHQGELYCFDRVSPHTRKPKDQAFDCGAPYRGHRWFDRYETAQLEAVAHLVDDLCTRFAIPREYPDAPFDYYGDALARFEGVIGHAMVRPDKSDPAPDPRLWNTLRELAALRPTAMTPSPPRRGKPLLTSREIETLFAHNAERLNAMDVSAGSLVKALIMELERRGTYLRLGTPAPHSHQIGYELVQGDHRHVPSLARALGFKTVTDRLLEVRHE